MVVRAALKLGFRGAEVAAFRRLGEPRFCRSRAQRGRERPVIEGDTATA